MHPHRRRKKRPNYGVRTVEVGRGHNGFGFTISGQQPCILSCIVSDSPADSAGLRAGDFLISVNGLNVSKLPHDAVVQLIGNSVGIIRMTIAENYFSDSSDEDILNGRSANRQRPKYPHANKSRMYKAGRISNYSPSAIKTANNVVIDQDIGNKEYKTSSGVPNNLNKDNMTVSKPLLASSSSAHCVIINPSISNKNDINNVSAMVNPGLEQVRAIKVVRDLKTGAMFEELTGAHIDPDKVTICQPPNVIENLTIANEDINKLSTSNLRVEPIMKLIEKVSAIECRAIVGYLGTIEMPKQIATSSKLQTVRSCIRKMRQEKRTPCTVLMTILPSCMTLKNASGELLAEYPAKRLNYVSCSSENDYRFFGLVTSASYPIEILDFDDTRNRSEHSMKEEARREYDIAISNSCHVFMIDTQIVDHQTHLKKADTFKITCTIDPVSGMCLEFPNNSEYIVNIIRIMYSLKPPNGFSGKCNIENISRLSNLDRKSCSPRGVNFVRKINRPKMLHDIKQNVRADHQMNGNNLQNEIGVAFQNDNRMENNPREPEDLREPEAGRIHGNDFVANSPQPSNHSEITTTSSNSDSGIGFHNDCQNISDRILVVDFPNPVRNNFNVPHVGPPFNVRDGKNIPLREANGRPGGVVGLEMDPHGQFLSNTMPVVEGFGGQGRPLNHGDPVLLGNIRTQLAPKNIFYSKKVDGEPSESGGSERIRFEVDEIKSPSTSTGRYLHSLNEVQKHAVKNKLAVRAIPDCYNPSDKTRKTDSCKSPNRNNLHEHSRQPYNQKITTADGCSPHYDPVYSDGMTCYEEHHYEIIYPDENNMYNENLANNEKCYKKSEKFNWIDRRHPLYLERAVDVAECNGDYFQNNGNNDSVTACFYDDMSVTSSKSHDYGGKKDKNYSTDDISIYSSKSHDEVVANSSKTKSESRKLQTSVDDILIFGFKNSKVKDASRVNTKKCTEKDQHNFLHPSNVKLKGKKSKKTMFSNKSKQVANNCNVVAPELKNYRQTFSKDSLLKYKLSPKVFGLSRPSVSVEDVCKSSTEVKRERRGSPGAWGHLEGTASEPDLRECANNGFFSSSGGSPFSRWGAGGTGGSGRALAHRSCRRPGSLAASEHDMYNKCEAEDGSCNGTAKSLSSGGVSVWATSLERLLSDPAGAHALSAFLEREFSAENIRFWTACERYARAQQSTRPSLAARLYSRHLDDGAPEPVNVDSHARLLAKERLSQAPPDLFLQAQKQIFSLMKFDSYPRFIKSDIHKECQLAELQGKPPPYPGDPALALSPCDHSPTPSPNKLKKSLSNAEDRRRKSLMQWPRKLRSKSRDRCREEAAEDDATESTPGNEQDPCGSNSSLLSNWDVARTLNKQNGGSSEGVNGALCRVLLPGTAATSSVVAVSGDETVRQLLDRLLRKRAVRYFAYEVYLPTSNKPIDIQLSSSILAGMEVTVEQRVVFRLDLPNRKVISVKSKPNKALGDVLKPILHKYGVGGSGGFYVTLGSNVLELTQPIQVADGQRLQVALRTTPVQYSGDNAKSLNGKVNEEANQVVNGNVMQVNGNATGAASLDEITNRVFEELLQGKADRHAGGNAEEESVKSDNCSSENSSGIFGRFLRRDDHRSKGLKKKPSPNCLVNQAIVRSMTQSASSEGGSSCTEEGSRRPIIAKLRAGVKLQNAIGIPTAENSEFLENLKQIQRARLKDKTAIMNPAPVSNGDFQKGKENNSNKLETNLFQYYDDKAPLNGIPVAATRATPTVQMTAITKPSPAPRLSLGQGSPIKPDSTENHFPKICVSALPKTPDLTDNNNYSPSKSAYNSLDNTVIENNQNLETNFVADDRKGSHYPADENDTQNVNSKYHGNLTQDYLNSSTTSGSDHFMRMRACDILNSSFHSTSSSCDNDPCRQKITDPPPLPPKPKVLPMKPPNWGHNLNVNDEAIINARMQEVSLPEINGNIAPPDRVKRTVYLDQPTSSFV